MKTYLSLLTGKLTNATIKEFDLGSGSTWPGHMALKVEPQFLKKYLKTKKLDVILIAGTNGKTTTSKLLAHILERHDQTVLQNEEGANMVNGITTTVVRDSTLFGNLRHNVAIFEVDENNLPKVLEQITPTAIVFLNLFRDQLDRYGEVHTIATKWKDALKKLPKSTKVILNADDPEIRNLLQDISGKTYYYSIPSSYFSKKVLAHDIDSSHCPNCGTELIFSKIAYSHLGKYFCKKCKFTNENIALSTDTITIPTLSGTYNMYNIQAAVKTAKEVFALPAYSIHESLKNFVPAFGRQESISYKGKNFVMLLSKNPAGFNQSLSVVHEGSPSPTVLLALNDRVPDGKDVSWIWDIDTDQLAKEAQHIIITGDRAYDMALRIKYSLPTPSQEHKVSIFENTKDAVRTFVKVTGSTQTGYILPTYSAMLEIRKIMTGKELL